MPPVCDDMTCCDAAVNCDVHPCGTGFDVRAVRRCHALQQPRRCHDLRLHEHGLYENSYSGTTCGECSSEFDSAKDCAECSANHVNYPKCDPCDTTHHCNGRALPTAPNGGVVSTDLKTCACTCENKWEGPTCNVCPDPFTGDNIDRGNPGHSDFPTCTLCTNEAHCTGHGRSVTTPFPATAANPQPTCRCSCTDSWTGPTCSVCDARYEQRAFASCADQHKCDFVKCDTYTCGAGFVDKPTKNNEACGAAVADCTDAKRCDPQAKCDTFTCARPGSPTRWARLRSCAGLRRPTATTGCAATLRAAGRELHVRPLSLLTLSHSPPPSPTQAPRRPHRPSSIPTLHPPATIQDGRGHDRVRRRVTCCDASCTEEPFACTAPAMILGKVATVRCGGSRKACCEPHRCRLRDDCLPRARRAPATVPDGHLQRYDVLRPVSFPLCFPPLFPSPLRCVALLCVAFAFAFAFAVRCVVLRSVALLCVALRCLALRLRCVYACVAFRCVVLRNVSLLCVCAAFAFAFRCVVLRSVALLCVCAAFAFALRCLALRCVALSSSPLFSLPTPPPPSPGSFPHRAVPATIACPPDSSRSRPPRRSPPGYIGYPNCRACTVSGDCSNHALEVTSNPDFTQCLCTCRNAWAGTSCQTCHSQFGGSDCDVCASGAAPCASSARWPTTAATTPTR